MERTRSTFPLVPVLWWPEPVTKLPNTAIMVPLPSVGQAMSWSNTASASPMIPDKLKRSMDECNIAYLHAQLFNPAMKFVGPVRKALGVRTLFNLLGPLVNPCKPTYQLLGVADLAQMRLYTNVFYKLGIDFAVVNSLDSYDEISLTDEFKVMTRNYERIYRPQALGFNAAQPEELFGGACKEDAARIFDNILNNRATRAQTQCVIVNAAFAIQVMEPEKEIEECIAIARQSLESGRALETLKKFIMINRLDKGTS